MAPWRCKKDSDQEQEASDGRRRWKGGDLSGPGRISPTKDSEKGHSALKEVVTREYTINTHKHTHGMGFKKCAPQALKEIRKFAKEEMRTLDVCIDTSLNKVIWIKGIRNSLYHIHVWLSRKLNEDEDSSNKCYSGDLCTCYHFQKSAASQCR
ncbi:60S ribosomal protein L31 [Tupaia chinensis]|uniref:Large ribosomal subunit protein eL31 n=1 Tax=Tupaia chinensis TaxID=246437 RepID=L9KLG5_TUPCH|nr:60S ribosomal protein L31 [Tupaia chinensis]